MFIYFIIVEFPMLLHCFNIFLSFCDFRFDRGLGGTEITLRLRKHLAQIFNEQKKTKTDVFTNERSMGKLFKEAEKLKKVLSANNAHFAQVG